MKNKIWIFVLLIVLLVSTFLTACNNNDDETPHTHSFETKWTNDEDYHWHNPKCSDTTEVKDKSKHDLRYTSFSDEEHIVECRICDYSVTEQHVIFEWDCVNCHYSQGHQHQWSEWRPIRWEVPSPGHLRYCYCGANEEEEHKYPENSYVCTVCEYVAPAGQQLEYTRKGNGYAVTGMGTFFQADLVIPEVYNGLPVIEIAQDAFKSCRFIENIVIPDSVETIAQHAFLDCDRMMSITFGTGLKTIEAGAFEYCRFTIINVKSLAAWCGINFGDEYSNSMYNGGLLIVDGERVDAIVIPDGVTKISAHAFDHCGYIPKIVIPVSVTSIGSAALNFYVDDFVIEYKGTMAQWNAIKKSDDCGSDEYTIICTDGTINSKTL